MHREKTSHGFWEDGRRQTQDHKDNHSTAIIIYRADIENDITRAMGT